MRRILPLLFVAAVACGPSAQQKLLKGTLTGLNAARDGFYAYDEAHQAELVRAATSYESGMAQLTLYREKREPVLEGFMVAYELVALAFEDTTAGTVAAAARAAEHVYKLVRELMESEKPPPPPHRDAARDAGWVVV